MKGQSVPQTVAGQPFGDEIHLLLLRRRHEKDHAPGEGGGKAHPDQVEPDRLQSGSTVVGEDVDEDGRRDGSRKGDQGNEIGEVAHVEGSKQKIDGDGHAGAGVDADNPGVGQVILGDGLQNRPGQGQGHSREQGDQDPGKAEGEEDKFLFKGAFPEQGGNEAIIGKGSRAEPQADDDGDEYQGEQRDDQPFFCDEPKAGS